MERRTYLRAAGTTAVAGIAGCLDGFLENGAEGAVLGPPDRDLGDPSHPIYGEEVPSFSVTDPFAEETITDEQFRGERAMMITFIFTSCPDGVCPALLQMLRAGQQDAQAEGYADDVAFIAITFDPEYDTRERLQEEADAVGIDPHADNWHFLRPEDNEAAVELVYEKFGTPVQLEDHEDHRGEDGEDGADDDHDHGGEGDGEDDDASGDTDSETTDGTHYDMILLVNENGIVERSYPRAVNYPTDEIVDDLRTVAEG
ncbi:SCO family protein [Halopiger goleimassiliensis]|uniref:SCO family protein n=1 Tax=Halopiger goleimassiliensis TaxID=1293048 RepID=UPI000677F0A4|nr:SCO family protein [Halopiger goleimassiliensis]